MKLALPEYLHLWHAMQAIMDEPALSIDFVPRIWNEGFTKLPGGSVGNWPVAVVRYVKLIGRSGYMADTVHDGSLLLHISTDLIPMRQGCEG